MTAPVRNDDPYKALGFWKWLIALGLLLLLLLCWFGAFGKMGGMLGLKAPSISTPVGGLTWPGGKFGLNGLGEANGKLGIYVNGAQAGTTMVGPDGKWNYDLDLSTPGDASIVARPIDAAGQALADLDSGALNVKVGAPAMAAGSGFASFISPKDNEVLDAQSYILDGTGTPGESLEVWQSSPGNPVEQYDTVFVAENGQWSYVVDGTKAGTKPGTYTYELRQKGSSEAITKRTVIVKAGQTQASNAKCPCKLRIFTLRKQNIKGSTITLFKDGKQVEAGTVDKLFGNLAEGEYTYTVSAPGYADFTGGKARVPRNKNFEVYLKPKR
jgi:hypothetical protein